MYNKKSVYIGLAILVVLLTVLIAGCTSSSPTASPTASGATPTAAPAQTTTLTVFAAASLGDAFNQTATAFEAANPNIAIKYSFAGTGTLVSQVTTGGATPDVFASASVSYMKQLANAGYMNNSTIANFTNNSLAIIVPVSNPANIVNVTDLAKPGVKIDVGAASVPCGSYTLQLLNKSANVTGYGPSFANGVRANIVSNETEVTDIVSKVALGEVDAGFVYVSDVPATMINNVTVIPIPSQINVIATYQIGVLNQSPNQAAAESFVQFVLSSQGKQILDSYKFNA
jgi:molybdate transport system substrate-binding protein